MKKVMKFLIMIAVIVIIVVVAVVGYKVFENSFKIGKDSKMISYSYTCGGGMTGGHISQDISMYDEEYALYTHQKAEWWNQDASVSEYLIDRAVLDDIAKVVSKYHMERWENRPLSKFIVLDGDTSSYHFRYDNKFSFSFSSNQNLPMKAREAEKAISEVITSYIGKGKKLPGLVVKQLTPEELMAAESGEDENEQETLSLEVYSYYKKNLCYRLNNSTEQAVEYSEKVRITDKNTGAVICEETDGEYTYTLSSKSKCELYVNLEERLAAGTYVLEFESLNLSCEFVIE